MYNSGTRKLFCISFFPNNSNRHIRGACKTKQKKKEKKQKKKRKHEEEEEVSDADTLILDKGQDKDILEGEDELPPLKRTMTPMQKDLFKILNINK